jgi:hypothetical protein
MSDLDFVFGAFQRELEKLGEEKTAVDYQRILGNAGALAGAGGLVGAAGGALVGGVGRYRQARAQGAGVAQGLGAGVGGAATGALKGGVLGAGAGAVGGAVAPKALYDRMSQMKGALGASSRFGQRQVHAATGWLPTAGDTSSIERIRGGAYGARNSVQSAVDAAARNTQPNKALGLEKTVTKARGGLEAAEKAQQMGLTSIPGYIKSLRDPKQGVLKTVGAGMAEQWRTGGIASKAFTVGVPAMGAVGAIRSAESPVGAGKGERIGRELGATAGGILTAPLPLVPGMAVGSALGAAGGLVGKGVDRLRGRKAPGRVVQHAVPPENVAGQHVPTERVMSPSAMGQSEAMA